MYYILVGVCYTMSQHVTSWKMIGYQWKHKDLYGYFPKDKYGWIGSVCNSLTLPQANLSEINQYSTYALNSQYTDWVGTSTFHAWKVKPLIKIMYHKILNETGRWRIFLSIQIWYLLNNGNSHDNWFSFQVSMINYFKQKFSR